MNTWIEQMIKHTVTLDMWEHLCPELALTVVAKVRYKNGKKTRTLTRWSDGTWSFHEKDASRYTPDQAKARLRAEGFDPHRPVA